MSGQLNAPAALIPGGWVGPESVWTRWWREKFPTPPPLGLEPPIIQLVAECYTTELSRLKYRNVESKIKGGGGGDYDDDDKNAC
jgi:hypothetical protein